MTKKHPSKNSRCPCGSGKKYRKCCKPKRPSRKTIEKVQKIFKQKEKQQQNFIDKHGHILPPQKVTMDGKAIFSIGGMIYKQVREGNYTFLDMIHDHALLFFGDKFLEQENNKPFEKRHPAIQWKDTLLEHVLEITKNNSDNVIPINIGAGISWYRFAFDLYTIRNNSEIENRMKRRLQKSVDFQSARHELWLAALFVAANFKIEYEDETDNSCTHPEFIAIDRESSLKIAVEAKSKHRRGIKGFRSGAFVDPGEKVNIRSLVLDAYKKNIELPLYVFIDVNLPTTTNYDQDQWIDEIKSTMNHLDLEGYHNPSPANVIFFVNVFLTPP